ncbi:MAG: SH3 domain-containing protein [Paracoccaceae bacterium]
MIRILTVLLALLPWPTLAHEIFPALYDVAGVAADDVLNVRAAPSAEAEITGSFAPAETGIEVIALSDDGAWGRVNAGEQAGWTSMHFLARQPGQTAEDWDAGFAPMTLACFGTEPFWTLSIHPGELLDYSALDFGDGTAQPGGYTAVAGSASTGKRGFFGWLDAEPVGFTGIVSTEALLDGMSDRDYGFAIDLILSDTDGDRLAAGCCRLSR